MPKVMLINVTHSEESRVGIMNEGVLESFEIESLSRSHLKGNIYKGVVHRIHPALEAAFVDIGADRDAFLPLDEICFKTLDDPPKGAARGNGENGTRRQLRIREVLRPGQELLVQITKEQFANKPPTVSTFYSLPGRYLVLLPGSEDTGISRRIEGEERDRLRKMVDALKPGDGFGLIVRTVAGLEENGNELPRDLEYLKRLWSNVQEAAKGRPAPSLVYREHDIVQRAIRDFYTPDISEIYIDDEEVYLRAKEFLHSIMPGSEAVLRLYRGEQPLFSAFHVEEQIESVFGRRVRLRSGGSIVIDGTEALTAIDVNSGGAVRGANPEETAFRTNREAATEVARQLRLRDIGGIVVVDFIDMRDPQHIREIEQLVRDEMRLDKARHETSRLSNLGLMQISRQRLRPAAAASSHATCPLCQGYGSVRTHGSAALGAIRKIHNRLSLGDVESMVVTLPTEVGLYVLNQNRDDLARLEARYESRVEIKLAADMLPHEVETEVTERSRTTKVGKAVEPGSVAHTVEVAAAPRSADAEAVPRGVEVTARAAEGENGGKRRKRRRRRRGGARPGEEGGTPSEAATAAPTAPRTAERSPATAGSAPESPRVPDPTPVPAAADATASTGPTHAIDARVDTSARDDAAARGRRSRGRRGGRRNRGAARVAEGGAGATAPPEERSRPARAPDESSRRDRSESEHARATSDAGPAPMPRAESPAPATADRPATTTRPAAKKRAVRKPRATAAASDGTAQAAPKRAAKKATAKKTTTKAAAKKPARKTAAKKRSTSKGASPAAESE
jgi:ribonuclease E